MFRRAALRLVPGLRSAAAACSQATCGAPSACLGATGLAPWPAAFRPDVCWQQQWQLGSARTASGSSGGGSGDGTSSRRRSGRLKRTSEPQPELQAWLEQRQGLPAAEAEQHARRLAHVLGSEQVALASLPGTFEACRVQGLTGLETAQLLDHIASCSRANVVNFESAAWRDWQLIDGHIAAYVQGQQQQPNKRQPKCTSLADVLRSSRSAAQSLVMPPGHVEAWLATVGKRLPRADLGRLLLASPAVVTGGVGNFAALQLTLQLPAEHVWSLVLKNPLLLTTKSGTAHTAYDWLQQHFRAEHLLALLERCPRLLTAPASRLQRNASYLQRELGWQPGDGQLAVFVDANPQPFAQLNFEGEETQAKLLFFTDVAGAERFNVLATGSTYLCPGLETTAALYMLMQELAPWMLFSRSGGTSPSWARNAAADLDRHGIICKAEAHAFVRTWPNSNEGQRLLANLRSGSTEGWPRPGLSPDEAVQQWKRAAAELKARKAAARRAPAAMPAAAAR